jgi:hypothetical protein
MEFHKEISSRIAQGKEELEYSIKQLLYQHFPEWFELLDFRSTRTFQEPLIYCLFNFSPDIIQIPQVLFGYVPKYSRPRKIRVNSDENGIIYLPNYAYLETLRNRQEFDLIYDADSDKVLLLQNLFLIPFKRNGIDYLPDIDIEVVKYNAISFSHFFEERGRTIDFKVKDCYVLHKTRLLNAFLVVKENCPQLFEMINDVVRKILIFSAFSKKSFVSIRANGCVFLNIENHQSEAHLTEDIVYQCAQIIQYYVLWNKDQLFEVNVNTPLNEFTKIHSDKRSVMDAFCSLLPNLLTSIFSKKCLENSLFNGDRDFTKRHNSRMFKLKTDVSYFDSLPVFTDIGRSLFEVFKHSSIQILNSPLGQR